MSFDYPLYDRMRREHPWLGFWWKVFDSLYYFFLLGWAILGIFLLGTGLISTDRQVILYILFWVGGYFLSCYGKKAVWKAAGGSAKWDQPLEGRQEPSHPVTENHQQEE